MYYVLFIAIDVFLAELCENELLAVANVRHQFVSQFVSQVDLFRKI